MAEGGVGFFKTLQAMNIASRQLIDIGKEYALQFKNKEIDDKKYEELMTGKLYEVVSYAVNQVGGSDEIARFLKKHLADALIEPLKTGISLYTQAIDTAQKTMSSTQPKTIKEALKHFDKKQKELLIKGYIYEVTTTKSDASGLSIVADVFKNAGVAITNGTKLSNFLSFKNSDVDFYFSALSKDDRFKILSRPSLRVRNHQSATLTVGRDVPTLGNVTYQDGQAVQSVTYRSSGVIFDIVPEILMKTVNLQIRQEMSNFAETVNGVNGSPTLVKRELKTNVTASSGETLVLGGLIENKDTDSSAGLSFLPSWTGAKSNTKENTEILLMLYVEII